jgi:hypothetical protein
MVFVYRRRGPVFSRCSPQRDLALGCLQPLWPPHWVQPTNATTLLRRLPSWHSKGDFSLEHIQDRAFQAWTPADGRVGTRRARIRVGRPWLRQCQIHPASTCGGNNGPVACNGARTCSDVVLALPTWWLSLSRKQRCHS